MSYNVSISYNEQAKFFPWRWSVWATHIGPVFGCSAGGATRSRDAAEKKAKRAIERFERKSYLPREVASYSQSSQVRDAWHSGPQKDKPEPEGPK